MHRRRAAPQSSRSETDPTSSPRRRSVRTRSRRSVAKRSSDPSARARACPASNLVGNSLDTPTCARRNAFVVAFGRHEERLTGRQGAADGRDVREAAVPHARGGGHRCARAPGRARATPTVDPRRRPLQRPASFIPSRPASCSLQKMSSNFLPAPFGLFREQGLLRACAKRSAERYANLQSPDPSSPIPLLSVSPFLFSSPLQVPSTCL